MKKVVLVAVHVVSMFISQWLFAGKVVQTKVPPLLELYLCTHAEGPTS
jgi:hypothetical protein